MRRLERVRQRQTLVTRVAVPTGLSLLEAVTVKHAIRAEYLRKVSAFIEWARSTGLDWDSMPSLDEILCEFFDVKLFQGGAPDEGAKLLAGLAYYDAELYRNLASKMPGAHRALKGWTKTGPAKQRLPFPFVLLLPVVADLIHHNHIDMSLRLMIQHNASLRPGEAEGLSVMQLAPPVRGATYPHNQWALNIAPFELQRPAQTGMMDESVTLDHSGPSRSSEFFSADETCANRCSTSR